MSWIKYDVSDSRRVLGFDLSCEYETCMWPQKRQQSIEVLSDTDKKAGGETYNVPNH